MKFATRPRLNVELKMYVFVPADAANVTIVVEATSVDDVAFLNSTTVAEVPVITTEPNIPLPDLIATFLFAYTESVVVAV